MSALVVWLVVGGSFGQFVWKPYLEPALNGKPEIEMTDDEWIEQEIKKLEKQDA